MKKVMYYLLALSIISIIAEITNNEIIGWFAIIPFIALYFDIGNAIKNEKIKKTYYLYTSIIIALMIVFTLLFNFTTLAENHIWTALTANIIVCIVFFVMLIKIANLLEADKYTIKAMIYMITFLCIGALIVVSALVLAIS